MTWTDSRRKKLEEMASKVDLTTCNQLKDYQKDGKNLAKYYN